MRISVERSTSFLVELVRDRIPFSVRYDGDAIIVSDYSRNVEEVKASREK